MTLATPENVTALDRAAEWISDESRWWGAGFVHLVDGRFCAVEAVCYFAHANTELEPLCRDVAYSLYTNNLVAVNDTLGRIPAKHCIEALAAQLRSELP